MQIIPNITLNNEQYQHELNQRIFETQQYLRINGWKKPASDYFFHLCDLEEVLNETYGSDWGQVEAEVMADEWTELEASETGNDYSAALMLSLDKFIKQYS